MGTIDVLRSGDIECLGQARDLATGVGALATAAVLDVQLAEALALRDDPEPALVHARRAAGLARRQGLSLTVATALGLEAQVHARARARARRRTEMETCLRRALALANGDRDVVFLAVLARTLLAFVEEDRPAAMTQLARSGVLAPGPVPGWWALVRSHDPATGDAAVAEVRALGEPDNNVRYAEAVVLGRSGRAEEAANAVAAADGLVAGLEWFRRYGRRLVAEAALADGPPAAAVPA